MTTQARSEMQGRIIERRKTPRSPDAVAFTRLPEPQPAHRIIKPIDFGKITKRDLTMICEIAEAYTQRMKTNRDRLDIEMDLCCVHISGTPLRLLDMLAAARNQDHMVFFNVIHDVNGIGAHLNRKTGELEDCFLPRYAR